MIPLSHDTARAVEEVWIDLLRKASPTRRFALMSSLSASVIRWSREGLRRARPGASDDDLAVEFVRLNYGDRLANGLATELCRRRAGGAR